MSRFLVVILVLAALLFPLTAAAVGTVPGAANSIAEQLDDQLMMRYAGDDPGTSKKQRQALARAQIMIMGTTPANINNLEAASPLARQMTEEISRWLVNAGYRYQELRQLYPLRQAYGRADPDPRRAQARQHPGYRPGGPGGHLCG